MKISSKYINWFIILVSSVILSIILWNTYIFVQNFKVEERNKMELWSLATLELIEIDGEISNLTLEVLRKNKTTPMIKVDNNGAIEINNINDFDKNDKTEVNKLIKKFSSENTPIKITLDGKHISTLYYGNSDLLNKLKFYPSALILIAALFGFIAFLFFKSSKIAELNMLWSGMAKETAHQIGTPLSSLMGWVELMKNNPNEKKYLKEVEKDLDRLNIISERFNKIGSKPKLDKVNIYDEIEKTIDYLRARLSKKINLEFNNSKQEIYVYLNKQLFGWSIENVVKNSIDAIKEKGKVTIRVSKVDKYVKIFIIDNGVGINKSIRNKIFKPGVTTKERGWGLGLSLAKRIIKEYHNGEIKVEESTIGRGTKMMIKLKGVK
ncbi:MAG: two-component sensor histidine kinase [Flammeovirgaceae bacterium]|nr:two-component sensor histidine kinase [Flammeovirgaceae bacterium]|tara:strand:+ start:21706 stop:22845 length:1140 start_codon:yes stop_codon:yes gene_type:complete